MSAIRYEVDDRVATITIDRPEKRNAMTYAVLRDFHEAVARAGSDDAVHAVVLEFNGSISAEHGIGVMKRRELAKVKSAVHMDLMRKIRAALDPKGILNPGKVL